MPPKIDGISSFRLGANLVLSQGEALDDDRATLFDIKILSGLDDVIPLVAFSGDVGGSAYDLDGQRTVIVKMERSSIVHDCWTAVTSLLEIAHLCSSHLYIRRLDLYGEFENTVDWDSKKLDLLVRTVSFIAAEQLLKCRHVGNWTSTV